MSGDPRSDAGERAARWDAHLLFGSVTRHADLPQLPLERERLPRDRWANGDFVVAEVTRASSDRHFELRNGRTTELLEGDLIVGALGRRYATLEATGSWEEVGEDGGMDVLTGGGVLGRSTSVSRAMGTLTGIRYGGHVIVEGKKATMGRFAPETADALPYETPTVLVVGTSMSAGKTTAARVIVRLLTAGGLRVVAAKVAGAGHYRDILSMADAGAQAVFDFVDVGLPSTFVPEDEYRTALTSLLGEVSAAGGDVAVIEVGASPLEPYNGKVAIEAIQEQVRFTVLCASDPYAVVGILGAHPLTADVVTGAAANTEAGIELVERLSGLPALNLWDRSSWADAARLLERRFGLGRVLPEP